MAYRNNLAALLANYPESPLTPGIPANYDVHNSPFNQWKKSNGSSGQPSAAMGMSTHHLTPATLNRYQMLQYQQQLKQQQDTKLSQLSSMRSSISSSSRSCGGNTSGYMSSFTTSNNSLEQAYAPYQSHSMHTPSRSSSSRYSPESSGTFLSPSSHRRSSECSGISGGGPMLAGESTSGYSPYKSMVSESH